MLHSAVHEIFLLINVKMPLTVGIVTFVSRINDWLWSLILAFSKFMSSLNFMLEKHFITAGPGYLGNQGLVGFIYPLRVKKRTTKIFCYDFGHKKPIQERHLLVNSEIIGT